MKRIVRTLGLCLLVLALLAPAAWGAEIPITPTLANGTILGTLSAGGYVYVWKRIPTFSFGAMATIWDGINPPYTFTWFQKIKGEAETSTETRPNVRADESDPVLHIYQVNALAEGDSIKLEVIGDAGSTNTGDTGWYVIRYIDITKPEITSIGAEYLGQGLPVRLKVSARVVDDQGVEVLESVLQYTWYQWNDQGDWDVIRDGTVFDGSDTDTLTIRVGRGGSGEYKFYCRVSQQVGSETLTVDSDPFSVLWALNATTPTISTGKADPGESVTFTTTATGGTEPYTIRWLNSMGQEVATTSVPVWIPIIPDDATSSKYYDRFQCKVEDSVGHSFTTELSSVLQIGVRVVKEAPTGDPYQVLLSELSSSNPPKLKVKAYGGSGVWAAPAADWGWFQDATDVSQVAPDGDGFATLNLGTLGLTVGQYAFSYTAKDSETTPAANTGTSETFTVNVVNDVAVNIAHGVTATDVLANDLIVPQNHVAELTATAKSGSMAPTWAFEWQESSNGSGWSPIPGINTSPYTIPTAAVGTKYYRCIATDTASNPTLTSLPSNEIKVQVYPPLKAPTLTETPHTLYGDAIVPKSGETMTFTASDWGGTGDETINFWPMSGGIPGSSPLAVVSGIDGKASCKKAAAAGDYDTGIMAEVKPVNGTFGPYVTGNTIVIKTQLETTATGKSFVRWEDLLDDSHIAITHAVTAKGGNTNGGTREDDYTITLSRFEDMRDSETFSYTDMASPSDLDLNRADLVKVYDFAEHFLQGGAPIKLYVDIDATGYGGPDPIGGIDPNTAATIRKTFTVYGGLAAILSDYTADIWQPEAAYANVFAVGGSGAYDRFDWEVDGAAITLSDSTWKRALGTSPWSTCAEKLHTGPGALKAAVYLIDCQVEDVAGIPSWGVSFDIEVHDVPALEIGITVSSPDAVTATGVVAGTPLTLTAAPLAGQDGTRNKTAAQYVVDPTDTTIGRADYWKWQWYLVDGYTATALGNQTGPEIDLGSLTLNLNGKTFRCVLTETIPGTAHNITREASVTLKVFEGSEVVKDFAIVNPGTMRVGDSGILLGVVFTPSSASGTIVWQSLSDAAEVDATGRVTPKKAGLATIRGTLEGTDMVRTISFLVLEMIDPDTTHIVTVPTASLTFRAGQRVNIQFGASPDGAVFSHTGTLPGDLILSSGGLLSGTVPERGSYLIESVTVTWPDGYSKTVRNITLTVTESGSYYYYDDDGGGGCSAGFAGLAFLLAIPLFFRRRS